MRTSFTLTLACFMVGFAGACGSDETSGPQDDQRIVALRDLTRPYQDFAQARAAGYDVKITDCMSDPQGAMGLHYGKGALIDGVVEEQKPEVMMYEPTSNGGLQLVGVEYVVPLDKWSAAEPPELFGQKFQRNEMFQVWALHAWIWRDNPKGLFFGWNPAVSCAHAGAVK